MSFSISFQAKRAELPEKLQSASAPESVKEFIRSAADSLKSHESVSVSAYGHLHDGTPGNYEPSSCTIEVKPA